MDGWDVSGSVLEVGKTKVRMLEESFVVHYSLPSAIKVDNIECRVQLATVAFSASASSLSGRRMT